MFFVVKSYHGVGFSTAGETGVPAAWHCFLSENGKVTHFYRKEKRQPFVKKFYGLVEIRTFVPSETGRAGSGKPGQPVFVINQTDSKWKIFYNNSTKASGLR